jgi:hypothetical protein
MAKKTKLVKEKKSKKNDDYACVIVGVIIGLIAVSALIYYCVSRPKYEVGDCLLNRAYEFKKVYLIDEVDYTLRTMKIDNFPFGADYALETDYGVPYQDKSIHFVDEHYTKIPCESH